MPDFQEGPLQKKANEPHNDWRSLSVVLFLERSDTSLCLSSNALLSGMKIVLLSASMPRPRNVNLVVGPSVFFFVVYGNT